ncbi:hypothetical protein VB773_06620 [Haloarculaceae archaeon H-GB2-1]|nr:hypothetical protein [Haloarculaceae archaeon H-GB1-1]MEA5385773.1 hypothetical protein [Haloarculaceae archaeon H-GB11]MEA5407277.1 hypothetical protein [Haloarculaceae archaeon H-GB2-1]
MDSERLERELAERYDASEEVCHIVSRQARDLDDSGLFADDIGSPLTVEVVIDNLDDAPEQYTLPERWNWWLDALELSHGGYDRFHVRSDVV